MHMDTRGTRWSKLALGLTALLASCAITAACSSGTSSADKTATAGKGGGTTPAATKSAATSTGTKAATTPSATTGATQAPAGAVIAVTLNEFAVALDKDTVPAGKVTFRATNEGPDDAHEMVIIRTDLAPGALPTAADGSVPEDAIDLVDEIEEIAVGESDELTVDLKAGSYVLICNIVQTEADGTIESHYQKGMRRALTVE